jgi:hypothetical protein
MHGGDGLANAGSPGDPGGQARLGNGIRFVSREPARTLWLGGFWIRRDDFQVGELAQPQDEVVCTPAVMLAARLTLDSKGMLSKLRTCLQRPGAWTGERWRSGRQTRRSRETVTSLPGRCLQGSGGRQWPGSRDADCILQCGPNEPRIVAFYVCQPRSEAKNRTGFKRVCRLLWLWDNDE